MKVNSKEWRYLKRALHVRPELTAGQFAYRLQLFKELNHAKR